jgi:methylated-DNA-[protein]-cysteine S-methyltransferase
VEAARYTLFDTAIGRCGLAWRGGSVIAFALPGESDAATLAHLARRHPAIVPAEPPPVIVAAITAIQGLLKGEAPDLSFIPIEMAGVSPFERQVYALLREVAPGATITYGELAKRAGNPRAARAVGMAMGRNPVPVIIPCHRVLAAGGRSGGFSAPGGVSAKFRLLEIERAARSGGAMLFEDLPMAVAPSSPRT